MKLQKLDDLLLNLVVVFEAARRIKGVIPLRTAEAAKQLVIRLRRGKISALILIDITLERGNNARISFNSLSRFAHCL